MLKNKNNAPFLKKVAVTASISVAVILSAIKLFAAVYTDSLAVLSSFVDSLTDVVSSFITLIAVYIALKPANCNYRYGFGKTEAVSAILQAVFICVSASFIVYDSINRIFHPVELNQTGVGILIMCISMAVTLLLILFQKSVAKKTSSLAISADSIHYVSDLATNFTIIISLIISNYFSIVWFDTLAAVFVALYLFHQAYDLGKNAFYMLADKELDENIRADIGHIIMETLGVMGFHDLRTRDLGGKYIFEFHLELDGNLSLYEAHKIAEKVEENILKKYSEAQIIIHEDPFGIKENRLDNFLPSHCQKV